MPINAMIKRNGNFNLDIFHLFNDDIDVVVGVVVVEIIVGCLSMLITIVDSLKNENKIFFEEKKPEIKNLIQNQIKSWRKKRDYY